MATYEQDVVAGYGVDGPTTTTATRTLGQDSLTGTGTDGPTTTSGTTTRSGVAQSPPRAAGPTMTSGATTRSGVAESPPRSPGPERLRNTLARGGIALEPPGDGNGVPIPTGSFRSVEATIENTEGEAIPEAVWVLPAEQFPVAVAVSDGRDATLRLLKGFAYDAFYCIVDRDESAEKTELAAFPSVEASVPRNAVETTLTFDESDPVNVGGLSVGLGGISPGGL